MTNQNNNIDLSKIPPPGPAIQPPSASPQPQTTVASPQPTETQPQPTPTSTQPIITQTTPDNPQNSKPTNNARSKFIIGVLIAIIALGGVSTMAAASWSGGYENFISKVSQFVSSNFQDDNKSEIETVIPPEKEVAEKKSTPKASPAPKIPDNAYTFTWKNDSNPEFIIEEDKLLELDFSYLVIPTPIDLWVYNKNKKIMTNVTDFSSAKAQKLLKHETKLGRGAPELSPDKTKLAFPYGQIEEKLYGTVIIDLEKKQILIYPRKSGSRPPQENLDWVSNDKIIMLADGIELLDLSTGKYEMLYERPENLGFTWTGRVMGSNNKAFYNKPGEHLSASLVVYDPTTKQEKTIHDKNVHFIERINDSTIAFTEETNNITKEKTSRNQIVYLYDLNTNTKTVFDPGEGTYFNLIPGKHFLSWDLGFIARPQIRDVSIHAFKLDRSTYEFIPISQDYSYFHMDVTELKQGWSYSARLIDRENYDTNKTKVGVIFQDHEENKTLILEYPDLKSHMFIR